MKRMVITAGPTHEAIDAVRYIANRSSGRMGIAIAEAAHDAGWDVTLLLGPVGEAGPDRIRVERFTSTEDLERLLAVAFPECDVLMMAAAVADYRPKSMSGQKIPRVDGRFSLELESTPDLVGACAKIKKQHQLIVGFALEEPSRLNERAVQKLRDKNLNAIVANPLETMGSGQIAAKVFTPDGREHFPPHDGTMDKQVFAKWLVGWIEREFFVRR
jgi:phosphopantothenoylcysteine decarboxylase/phosphopantothenate--cysteine ligase